MRSGFIVVQVRDHWWAVMNTVMNLLSIIKCGEVIGKLSIC